MEICTRNSNALQVSRLLPRNLLALCILFDLIELCTLSSVERDMLTASGIYCSSSSSLGNFGQASPDMRWQPFNGTIACSRLFMYFSSAFFSPCSTIFGRTMILCRSLSAYYFEVLIEWRAIAQLVKLRCTVNICSMFAKLLHRDSSHEQPVCPAFPLPHRTV